MDNAIAMRNFSKKKAALVVVCIAAIGLSLWSIRGQLQENPEESSEPPSAVQRLLSSIRRSLEDHTILNWRISAIPTFALPDRPRLGTGPEPVRWWPVAKQIQEAPVIRIDVEMEFKTKEGPSSIWSEESTVQLFRSTSPDGNYTQVLSVNPAAELEAVNKAQAENLAKMESAIKAMSATTGKPGVPLPRPPPFAPQAAGTPSPVPRFHLVDREVTPGVRYYYKIQFLPGRKATGRMSGYCSAFCLPLPVPRVEVDEKGFANLSWDAVNLETSGFLRKPKWVIRLVKVHEVGRLAIDATSFKLPLRFTSPLGFMPRFDFGIEAVAKKAEWEMKTGQKEVVTTIKLHRELDIPLSATDFEIIPPFRTPTHWRNRAAVLVTAGGVGPFGDPWGGFGDSSPPEVSGGELAIFCLLSGGSPACSISSPGLGEKHWKAYDPDSPLKNNGYQQEAGVCEKCSYTFQWEDQTIEGGEVIAKLSTVRHPLPTGLVAVAGDGCVKLKWDGFKRDEKDWVEGPEFILRRSEETQADFQKGKKPPPSGKEIYRAQTDATEHIDRDVQNGRMYFYTLEVEGVTRATSWCAGIGEYECFLPVRISAASGLTAWPAAAMPAPGKGSFPAPAGQPPEAAASSMPAPGSGPVRMALLLASRESSPVNAAGAHLWRALKNVPGVELVERSAAPALFEEYQLAQFNQRKSDARAALPADVILRCRGRPVGYNQHFDVWLEDYRNSRKERLISVPLNGIDLERTAALLLAEINRRFPVVGRKADGSGTKSGATPQTVAIAGLLPLAKEKLPEGAMEDVLTGALSAEKSVKVVERENLRKIIRELGLSGTTGGLLGAESVLRLGKLLKADAILTGFYGISGQQVSLSVRLIDVETGALLGMIEINGDLENPKSLGEQLGHEIVSTFQGGQPSTDHPSLRWLESLAYAKDGDRFQGAQTAAYLSPETTEYHFDMGKGRQAKKEYEESLACFYNGLNLAEKQQEDPWRFYVAAGEVLQILKRTEEEVKLWQRAVADRKRRGADASVASLNLGKCLKRLEKSGESLASLREVKAPSYEVGRMYEEDGRPMEAVKVYSETMWGPSSSPGYSHSLTASYAAMVRLLRELPNAQKVETLKILINRLGARRPYQTIKAAEELLRLGGEDAPSLSTAANATRQVGQTEKQSQFIERRARLAGSSSIPSPRPSSAAAHAVSNARPIPREAAVRTGGLTYSVDEKGVVFCTRDADQQTLWSYDMRPRAPEGTDPPHPYSGGRTTMVQALVNGQVFFLHDLTVLRSTVCLDGDLLFVSNILDGVLHAIDVKSGQRRWAFVDWLPITASARFGEQVCVGNSAGGLQVLSRTTGETLRTINGPIGFEAKYPEKFLWLKMSPQKDSLGFFDPSTTLFDGQETAQEAPIHVVVLDDSKRKTVEARLGSDVDALISGILDRTSKERSLFIANVRKVQDREKAVPVLLQVVSDQAESEELRAAAIPVLSEVCGKSFVSQLLGLLVEKSSALRRSAATCLGSLGDRNCLDALAKLLTDVDEGVRRESLRALVRLGGKDARRYVQPFLDDPGSPLRSLAALELVRAGDQSLIPMVKEICKEETRLKSDETCIALCGAIGLDALSKFGAYNLKLNEVFIMLCKAGDPDAFAELERTMAGSAVEWMQAVQIIGVFVPEKRFIPAIVERLKPSLAPEMKQLGSEALARIGDPSVIPVLIELLPAEGADEKSAPSSYDRRAIQSICSAVESLSGQSFGDDKRQWETWWQTAGKKLMSGR